MAHPDLCWEIGEVVMIWSGWKDAATVLLIGLTASPVGWVTMLIIALIMYGWL